MISSAKAGISAKFSMQRLQAIFVINSNLNELMNDGGRYIFPKSKPLPNLRQMFTTWERTEYKERRLFVHKTYPYRNQL